MVKPFIICQPVCKSAVNLRSGVFFVVVVSFFFLTTRGEGHDRRLVCSLHTVFTRISAAALITFFAPQVRRLLKKEILSFNLTEYLQSERKITVSNRSVYCSDIHFFRLFSVVSSLNSDLTLPFYNNPSLEKDISSAFLDFLYSGF